VAADANDEAILADLERLLARDGGEMRYGYVLREPLPPESSLAELDLKSEGPPERALVTCLCRFVTG
jgi:hypothetical protein